MNSMRSKELAELAGVSVRTLRHYHQIGLLPEPERGANDYRRYGLVHVALLLRIRRLAALGVPLDRMPAFLSDTADRRRPGEDAGAGLLDEVDRELAARIALLEEQRAKIARLREDGGRPDLPAAVDAVGGLLGAAGLIDGGDLADLERDAALVVAGLGGDTHEPDLQRFAATVADVDHDALADGLERYRLLAPSAPQAAVDEVVSVFLDLFAPAMVELLASDTGARLRDARPGQVPDLDDDPRLNPAQLAVLHRVAAHLEGQPGAGE